MTSDIGAKIKDLRKRLGESQAQFGHRFNVEQATVSRWERNLSPPEAINQEPIARLAGMTVAEFFYSDEQPRIVPIVGEVGEGEKFRMQASARGYDIQHVKLSLGDDADQVALRVTGDAMFPVYRDGDALIGVKLYGNAITRALNKDCIVCTMGGAGFVKILKAGSTPHRYRLRSYNPAVEDIEDVELQWAAPIIWIGRT